MLKKKASDGTKEHGGKRKKSQKETWPDWEALQYLILDDPPLIEREDEGGLGELSKSRLSDEDDQKSSDSIRHALTAWNADSLSGSKEASAVDDTNQNIGPLLLVDMFDLFTQLIEPDRDTRKAMLQTMLRALLQKGVIRSVHVSEEVNLLRAQYRRSIIDFCLHDAWQRGDKTKPKKLGLPALLPSAAAAAALLTNPNPRFGHPQSDVRERAARTLEFLIASRYMKDFEELSELGKGGFGKVVKVRSRVDGCEYAVKKIKFDITDIRPCIMALKEVRMLAKMNHPHVVRYFSAWVEQEPEAVTQYSTAVPHSSSKGPKDTRSRGPLVRELSQESNTNEHLSTDLRRNLSSPSISFARSTASKKKTAETDDEEEERSMESHSAPGFWAAKTSREDESEMSVSDASEVSNKHAVVPYDKADLAYIRTIRDSMPLMELCSLTLRDYLGKRNANASAIAPFQGVDSNLNERLLLQLLRALDHVHSRGLIHRDVKPGNIFLRLPGNEVLLGDFGLACDEATTTKQTSLSEPLSDDQPVIIVEEPSCSTSGETDPVPTVVDFNLDCRPAQHSQGVGTLTYSAPEQLNSHRYDSKVDMFSVGVVAYELYHPFRTYGEKMHRMMEVRRGTLGEDFQLRWPIEASVIRQLVHFNPALRPSAQQLLAGSFLQSNEKTVNALEAKIRSQADEIDRLKRLLGQNNAEFD